MAASVWGIVKEGRVVPSSPLPEGARVEIRLADPPADVLAGRPLARKRICRTFSECTTAPRNGLVSGCYPLDPYYKARPEAEILARLETPKPLG